MEKLSQLSWCLTIIKTLHSPSGLRRNTQECRCAVAQLMEWHLLTPELSSQILQLGMELMACSVPVGPSGSVWPSPHPDLPTRWQEMAGVTMKG